MTAQMDMYEAMLAAYGPQGWWPLLEFEGVNPTKTGSVAGYHVGLYDFPRTERQRFEICVGAVLAQNTAWPNVEKALHALEALDGFSAAAMLALPEDVLTAAIRPSGYYNTKARKVRCLAEFLQALGDAAPSREALLEVWGVGPETADAILLYAYAVPEMVVDAYTRRIFSHLGMVDERVGYEPLKRFCEQGVDRDLVVRQEFHALLVEHAKRHYARKPFTDPLFDG